MTRRISTTWRERLAAALILCVAATSSCTTVPTDDGAGGATSSSNSSTSATTKASSSSGAEGSSSSGGPSTKWACVGTITSPAPSGASAPVFAPTLNVVSLMPIGGVLLQACAATDLACASPLDEATSDEASVPELEVPTPQPAGFVGFFRTSGGGQMPGLHFFRAIASSGSVPLLVATPSEAAGAAALAGVALDSSRGQMVVATTDCDGQNAAGVVFTVDSADADTTVVYVGDDNLPDPSLTQTGTVGAAVIFNVPAGALELVVTEVSPLAPVVHHQGRAVAGELTHIYTGPQP